MYCPLFECPHLSDIRIVRNNGVPLKERRYDVIYKKGNLETRFPFLLYRKYYSNYSDLHSKMLRIYLTSALDTGFLINLMHPSRLLAIALVHINPVAMQHIRLMVIKKLIA